MKECVKAKFGNKVKERACKEVLEAAIASIAARQSKYSQSKQDGFTLAQVVSIVD